MKPLDYPLLADENIHPLVIAELRRQGRDIEDVQSAGLIGSDDLTLLRWAYSRKRVILTHDNDFGALAVAGMEPTIGLIFIRPGHIDPTFTLATLQALHDQALDLNPPFLVVAQRRLRGVSIRVRTL